MRLNFSLENSNLRLEFLFYLNSLLRVRLNLRELKNLLILFSDLLNFFYFLYKNFLLLKNKFESLIFTVRLLYLPLNFFLSLYYLFKFFNLLRL